MKRLPGVFQARKKNGDIYFRSSVTFRGKHISLGSFATQEEAHRTYTIAANLLKSEIRFLPDDYGPCELPLFQVGGFEIISKIMDFISKRLFIYRQIILNIIFPERMSFFLMRMICFIIPIIRSCAGGVIFLWQIMECRSISHPVMGSKTLPWRTGIIVL